MAFDPHRTCSALKRVLHSVQHAVIGTIFFVSGVVTLLQTFVGDRLPIIQVRVCFAEACTLCSHALGPFTSMRGALHCTPWDVRAIAYFNCLHLPVLGWDLMACLRL